ncbi:glycosyltransferase [Sphaerothrix gracilis]|uniref:glycosyltransferase n=1 Tax=Sphaerothrix gracilis TaxID=3151835 RepID=UPI0031FCFA12
MMKIGWFFNAHGSGHYHRLQAILPYFAKTTQLTSLSYQPAQLTHQGNQVPHITLPAYNQTGLNPYLRKQAWQTLHGMQLNHGVNAPVFAALTRWLATWRPDLMVVDVALEIALAARLCGIPVVYVRQHGKRWDLGHQIAYEGSMALIAPFSAAMEQADCPGWIQRKTWYSGGFCRFQPGATARPRAFQSDRPNIVVLIGSGGTAIQSADIAAAAQATPTWQWFVLGQLDPPESLTANVRLLGRIKTVHPYLQHADLVVANAGHNTVMEIGAVEAPFLCLPAQRPFKEQLCKAEVLSRLDLAVVRHRWPSEAEWPALLQTAQAQPRHQWQTLRNPAAPQHIAQQLEAWTLKCLPIGGDR